MLPCLVKKSIRNKVYGKPEEIRAVCIVLTNNLSAHFPFDE